MTEQGQHSPSLGYTLVLPAGWVMIPTGDGAKESIDALVRKLSVEAPRDSRSAREDALRHAITPVIEQARAANARDVILPIAQPWVVPASTSITIGTIAIPPQVASARDLNIKDATRGESSLVATPAGTALRELVIDAPDPEDADAPLRHVVTYTWVPQPGTAVLGTLVVAATHFDGDQQILDALQELGEAVMASIAWTTSPTTTAESENTHG